MLDVRQEYVVDATLLTRTGEKRKRVGRLKSKIWEHFTKLENMPGKHEECMCNYCEKLFSCSSIAGTTHLKRHIFLRRCAVYKNENEDKSQSLLNNEKGSLEQASNVGPWKREGRLRSKVWEHFTKLENMPGKHKECMCNYCKKLFSCSSAAGTTHLKRHIFHQRCAVYKNENEDKSQSLLNYEKGSLEQASNVGPGKFDQERSWRDLTELIINLELPFNFVEDPSFQKFILGIYPKYNFVSSNMVRSDSIKCYEIEKNILKEILQSSNPRVCLTTNAWTSGQGLQYMALKIHFIDNGWKLQKRIINFVMVPIEASVDNLADIIKNCLLEWNIEKICTITLDDSTANDLLARTLSGHYSSRRLLLLQGRAIQVHCWGHVLNSIVQEGLDEIKDSICRVRNAVKYVKVTPRKKVEFLQYVDQERIPRGKMLVLDICTWWNSTYKMLGSTLHYRKDIPLPHLDRSDHIQTPQ